MDEKDDRPSEAITVDTLRPEHIDDLRALASNPRHKIYPVRRKLFKRLLLIRAIEPPRPPTERRTTPPAQAHELTALGQATLAAHRVVE